MDDNLQVIQDDPLAGGKYVHRDGADTMIVPQSPFDFAGDCLEMRFRCPGANHEKIRERGDPLQIQDDDIFRFLVRREMGAGFG